MATTLDELYAIFNNNTYGETPKQIDFLQKCVKDGWAKNGTLAGLGETGLYNKTSALCLGLHYIEGTTFYDDKLQKINANNQRVTGNNAIFSTNRIPEATALNVNQSQPLAKDRPFKDMAVYINPYNIKKVRDLRNTHYMRDDLVYISTYNELSTTIKPVAGATENVESAISMNTFGLCGRTKFNGADTYTDLNPQIDTKYDDWIVVTAAQMYGRENASAGERVKIGGTPYVNQTLNGLNGLSFEKKIIKGFNPLGVEVTENTFYKLNGVTSVQGRILQILDIPNFVLNNSPCQNTQTRGYDLANATYQIGFVDNAQSEPNFSIPIGMGYPWAKFCGTVDMMMLPLTKWTAYPVQYIVSSRSLDNDKSMYVSVNEDNFSTDPAEYYGAKTVWFNLKTDYKNATYVAGNNPEGNKLTGYPAFGINGSLTDFYSSMQQFVKNGNKFFQAAMIFPNETALENFLNDWGILYCTNEDDAKNAPNSAIDSPDYNPTDPWWDGDLSDPDAPADDPWENPTTPTDPVQPDPTNPGVDPAPDAEDVPNINLSGNCYLMSRNTLNSVEQWLLGDDFLNNSSNLFTDKMSAINCCTIFPLDLATHDSANTPAAAGVSIAGATKELEGVKQIGFAYNNCIDGGTLTYGTDWTAATPAYNAFLNANYTVNIPCLGSVQIPPSACVGRKLLLKYYIDLIGGGATAVLYSYPTGAFNDGFVDSGFIVFSGGCQLGQPVPLYSSNYTQRQLAIATSTISAIFAPLTGGNSFTPHISNTAQMQNGFIQKSAGSSAAMGAAGAAGIAVGAAKYLGNIATAGIKSAIQNPLEFNLKGSYGAGNAWSMGLRASLTISYQIPTQPNNYQYIMGQTAAQRGRLKKFTGTNANPTRGGLNYVECSATKLSINGATETELEMIQNTLSNGIFI